jgi:pimeloyl-ACP methyl ester carboxylesterase
MPSINVRGTDLYYEMYGDGAPILGIHGTPSSAVLWVDAARELAAHGTCVIYDRRGFHRSVPPGPLDTIDLAEHVDDALALLAAVSPEPAVVVGRSTGGQIALALAHRAPDRVKALVLLEPGVFTVDSGATAWADGLRDAVLRAAADDPGRASEVVLREALGDEVWESLPDELASLFADASPAVLAEIRGRGLDLSAEPFRLGDDELAAISQPTLIMSGEDSPEPFRRVSDRLATGIPDADQVLVAGGHFINPAHPEVLTFIGRVTER